MGDRDMKPSGRGNRGGTSTSTWDLTRHTKRLNDLLICKGWMRHDQLKPGSSMRRRGAQGVSDWKEDLRGMGMCLPQYHLSVYMPNNEDEGKVADMTKRAKDIYADERDIPSVIELPRKGTFDDLRADICDGGHRWQATCELHDETKDEIEKDLYLWVPVAIYQRAIVPDVIFFSKVINDQGITCVHEDALEVLTFHQGMIDACTLKLQKESGKGKKRKGKKATTGEVLEYLKDLGQQTATDKYERMIIDASMAVMGDPTEHLKEVINAAETRADKVTTAR
jgi:hypothetical protein